ncbi:MAG: gluconate 2-dehydrogenase subunit 3 family protein [Gemmatimonadota bacterium]|nr:gluconate 2-dehydrogenase subunit 3 family protein [Gemmatimonadota bacterium]
MTEQQAAPILEADMISRREAILRVTAILGGVALVGGTALLTGCRQENTDAPFTPDEIAFLDEIAETILPQTTTPGAKAAKTGAFMALIVTDSYSPEERKAFREGMHKLDKASDKAYGVSFVKATPQQRLTLLNVVDREQYDEGEARRAAAVKKAEAFLAEKSTPVGDVSAAPAITAKPATHYFRMMKELALLGYFTSEIGCTQAQRYAETPGRYDPCIPYTPGQKVWAAHA